MAKILIIDDDELACRMMSRMLEPDGYELATALSGAEGIKAFDVSRPDIVLVDYNMPGMNGLDVLKAVRAKDESAKVFIVTGDTEVKTAVMALRAGAFDYITKPIDYEQVSLGIKRALEDKKLRQDLEKYLKDLEAAHKQLKFQQVQLIQAAKLTAVGELGAGVAHEMNQPLMAILAHMESLLMHPSVVSDTAFKEKLVKIKDQFVRLGTIVKRMHDYAGSRTEGMGKEDLNRPLKDVFHLIGQQLKDRNIEVTMDLADAMPAVLIDRYQIQDIAVNFLINARDAVEERYAQESGGKVKLFSMRLKSGKGLVAGVIDNGISVKSGTESSIFDPFFTTKAPGKGTGLGLSVCYTIMKNHGGIIGFQPVKQGSKIFYFALPLDKDKVLVADAELAEELKSELSAISL